MHIHLHVCMCMWMYLCVSMYMCVYVREHVGVGRWDSQNPKLTLPLVNCFSPMMRVLSNISTPGPKATHNSFYT